MTDLIPRLGWGTTQAALWGAAFLLAKYTGPSVAIGVASVAYAALQKLRENSGLADAAATAAPGVALGGGVYFMG